MGHNARCSAHKWRAIDTSARFASAQAAHRGRGGCGGLRALDGNAPCASYYALQPVQQSHGARWQAVKSPANTTAAHGGEIRSGTETGARATARAPCKLCQLGSAGGGRGGAGRRGQGSRIGCLTSDPWPTRAAAGRTKHATRAGLAGAGLAARVGGSAPCPGGTSRCPPGRRRRVAARAGIDGKACKARKSK
jgi:hypothetical protein